MATLTRSEMEHVIKSGGSVLWQGRTLSRIQDLPSAADLAQGDPTKEAEVAADLSAQIASLQAQIAQLAPVPVKASKKKPAEPAEPTEGDEAEPIT